MNAAEAERAFREQLPCETLSPDVNTRRVKQLGIPVQLLVERHESGLTRMFLSFKGGEKSISRYQIEMLKVV